MHDQGIDEQRIVNAGLPAIARDLDLPLVCTNDVHYLRRRPQAARHPAVHRHRQGVNDTDACAITATSSS